MKIKKEVVVRSSSSVVERSTVNRLVVGSNPTWSVCINIDLLVPQKEQEESYKST